MLSPDPKEAAFADALWRTELPIPLGLRPAKRFNIHRNNVYAGLMACLKVRFPVVARLVGDDFFAQCARVFIEGQPPRSAVLLRYGADFPAFITAFEPARALPYLADVAELEWQRHVAQHGPDAAPLDPTSLAVLPAEHMDDVIFELHPTSQLLQSAYPVLSIWHTNTFDAVTQLIPTGSPGETMLILRPRDMVLLLRLNAGADVFLANLLLGVTLGGAASQALAATADFDLATTLAMLLRAEALTGFHRHPDSQEK